MLQIPASNLLRLLGRHLPGAGTEPDLPAALLTPAHRGAHQREFSLVIPLKVLALTTANFAAGQPSVIRVAASTPQAPLLESCDGYCTYLSSPTPIRLVAGRLLGCGAVQGGLSRQRCHQAYG